MQQNRILHRLLTGAVLVVAAAIAASVPAAADTVPLVQPVCPTGQPNPFTDLSDGSIHTPNVICAGQIGAVNGGPGGQPSNIFGPTLTTTRGQLASLVLNLIETYDMELGDPMGDYFMDDDGHAHERSINHLVELDIVDITITGQFAPDAPATRGTIAGFMYGAWTVIVGDDLPPGPDAFGDDDGHPNEDQINALAAAGVVSGKSPGVFEPNVSVTREQIATMFVQFLEKAAEELDTTN